MQNQIIMATNYPTINAESVRFVKGMHQTLLTREFKVTYTRNPLHAQRFGSEATLLAKWLQESFPSDPDDNEAKLVYSATTEIDISRNDFDDGRDYASVDVVVQINSSYESMQLFSEFKEKGYTFEQERGGYAATIGSVDGREICLSPQIHRINGINVLYVEPTSVVVDWDKIETWIKSKVRKDTPILNCPSRLLSEIRRIANEKKEPVNG